MQRVFRVLRLFSKKGSKKNNVEIKLKYGGWHRLICWDRLDIISNEVVDVVRRNPSRQA